jgi:hypothetical protein
MTPISDSAAFSLEGGRHFSLPVLDSVYELEDLADEFARAGKLHRHYLAAVAAKVQQWTGIQLTLGEADELLHELGALLDAKKKRRRVGTNGSPPSPTSTTSTPTT